MSTFVKSCLLASGILLANSIVLATEEAAVPATEHNAAQVDATLPDFDRCNQRSPQHR